MAEDLHEESPEDCLVKFTMEATGYDSFEPTSFITDYKGKIYSGYCYEKLIGSVDASVVNLAGGREAGHSSWDLFDCHSSDLAAFLPMVRHAGLMPSVAKFTDWEYVRVIAIHSLYLKPEWRKKGLGQIALEITLRTAGQGCELAALVAFPTQWAERVSEDPAKFRKDRRKLISYYEKAGFSLTRYEGIMVKAMDIL